VSDDGALSIVVIALLGNPFSPRYARARGARLGARALDFCALNVAVYGPRGALWALHERSIPDEARDARSVTLGDSHIGWEGDALVVDIVERTSPFGRPLRGRVTFRPSSSPGEAFQLDTGALHTWWPVAPEGRLEVALEEPSLRFAGSGYHDANAGDVPLESSFSRWTWSRSHLTRGRTCITYDVAERAGTERGFALDIRGDSIRRIAGLGPARLPTTRWGIRRQTQADASTLPAVRRSLEDTPFYARALVEAQLEGLATVAVHESLSLDRFASPWVQFLLQFRMSHE